MAILQKLTHCVVQHVLFEWSTPVQSCSANRRHCCTLESLCCCRVQTALLFKTPSVVQWCRFLTTGFVEASGAPYHAWRFSVWGVSRCNLLSVRAASKPAEWNVWWGTDDVVCCEVNKPASLFVKFYRVAPTLADNEHLALGTWNKWFLKSLIKFLPHCTEILDCTGTSRLKTFWGWKTEDVAQLT